MNNKSSNIITLIVTLIKIISICSDKGQNGFVTHHLFKSSDTLTSSACYDGTNGIITKWKISNIDSIFPYVTAWNKVTWNSPKCGECILLKNKFSLKKIYVTVIDQFLPQSQYDSQFDLSTEAFSELFGDKGISKGHGFVQWETVPGWNCKGNKK